MNGVHQKKADKSPGDISTVIHGALQKNEDDQLLVSNLGSMGTQHSWRRVEDELPEKNEVVLVCFKSGHGNSMIRTMAYRIREEGRWRWSTDLVYEEPDWYYVDDIEVTHWMPLPELPPK
jgi:hypothetical protein